MTKEVADEAIGLPADTGLHGHKYANYTALAVIAGRQRGRVAGAGQGTVGVRGGVRATWPGPLPRGHAAAATAPPPRRRGRFPVE
ncbi:hypothetical protein [Streptomyces sp. NPDC048473]|uniref:hypothetical protein n=1 Tax=unclassified Streptomyces TaxID=2593676 RepID=UPI00371E0571